MPSFLNKVFGYKKHEDSDPARDAPDGLILLDGKYEAIPPAAAFVDAQPIKDSDRDIIFSLFKPKSRGFFQKSSRGHTAPHLTLQLPGPKDNADARGLGVVFEADPDSQLILDDAVIAAKRLSPLEALALLRACAHAITERGLETLGIMHPHWFSASPTVQRKLISLFIHSLTPHGRITTLPPPTPAFENELHYTRSPRDVAAVLRWGLRHLTLENDQFGKGGTEWAWYTTFFQAERNASYPHKAFSELLLPHLPASHVKLLTATLALISSLAAHAEANSISGSKLSKFLGIWLLVATRADASEDWNQFYARWERAGRILEHLFLARLREESLAQRLPTRLQELVTYYPYSKGASTADGLLTRPRFSTRQYDALCVRVETVLTLGAKQPKQHPIQLLLDAFQLPIENPSGDEYMTLWNTLKTLVSEEATSSHPEGPQLARIFVDETMQLLSLMPAGSNATSPLLASPVSNVVSRTPSSLSKAVERALAGSNGSPGSTPASPTSPSSPVITDWAQFSLSGFGDTPTTQPLVALVNQDEDIEVTQPRLSRKSSRRHGKSRSRRRPSAEREPVDTQPSPQRDPEAAIVETKLASAHVVQIDEAFIDFWSDAIVDPISANWPTFVVCGLKDIHESIRWLLIEQAYTRPQPSRNPSPEGRRGRSPRPSFRSDITGFRINSVLSSARKRLSVFSKSTSDLDPKKSGGKTLTAGELGQVTVEEEPATSLSRVEHGDGNAAVASGTTADVADQLTGVSVFKEMSGSVATTAEAHAVEPSAPSCASVEQASDTFDPKVDNGTGSISVAAGTVEAHTSESIVLTLGPRQEPVDADVRPVEPVAPADGDERLFAEPLAESSSMVEMGVAHDTREVAEAVVISPSSERVQAEVAKPISVVGDESIAEDAHVDKQLSRIAPVNVATSAAEPVDDPLVPLSAVNAAHMALSETRPQLTPNAITSVGDGKEEAQGCEFAEIPTPALERVALVEETPGREVCVDMCGRDVVQIPAAENGLDNAACEAVAADLDVQEASIIHLTTVSSGEIAQGVPAPAEHAADQVSAAAAQDAPSFLDGTHVDAVEALAVPDVEGDVSAGMVGVVKAVEVPAVVRDQGAPMPDQHLASVDAHLVSEMPAEAHAPLEVPPGITPECDAEKEAEDAVVHAKDEAAARQEAQGSIEAELPPQVLAEPSVGGDAPAALATGDEAMAVQPVDPPTEDAPEPRAGVLESGVVEEDAVEMAVDASNAEPSPDGVSAVSAPVAEQGQALVEDAVAAASAPGADTPRVVVVEAPERAAASGPQSIGDAVPLVETTHVDAPVPEPTSVEDCVPAPVVQEDASAHVEPASVVSGVPDEGVSCLAQAVSMEEASGVVGPQEGVDAAEQPETAPVDAAAQAPAPVDPPAEP